MLSKQQRLKEKNELGRRLVQRYDYRNSRTSVALVFKNLIGQLALGEVPLFGLPQKGERPLRSFARVFVQR